MNYMIINYHLITNRNHQLSLSDDNNRMSKHLRNSKHRFTNALVETACAIPGGFVAETCRMQDAAGRNGERARCRF